MAVAVGCVIALLIEGRGYANYPQLSRYLPSTSKSISSKDEEDSQPPLLKSFRRDYQEAKLMPVSDTC
jgi:hypothetical protein